MHGHFQNLYIPLAFFLIKDKKTESYTIALTYLVSECQKLKFTFSPNIFYVDFVKAIHKAIGTVFPFSTIKGCRFHLGQNWWRKIQQFQLISDYKDDKSEVGHFLKHFFGLAFRNACDVGNSFIEDLMAMKPISE